MRDWDGEIVPEFVGRLPQGLEEGLDAGAIVFAPRPLEVTPTGRKEGAFSAFATLGNQSAAPTRYKAREIGS